MSKPMVGGGGATEDLLMSPLSEASVDDLRRLFLTASKPSTQWYVGLELELAPFVMADHRPAQHAQLVPVLRSLGSLAQMTEEHEEDEVLVGLRGHGQLITVEPGGQLEMASRPHRALKALRVEVMRYCDQLREAGEASGIGFWAVGQRPFVDVAGAPKMPRDRYRVMRSYLGQRGPRALEMMHLTSSVQCTVDFQDEANFTNKIRTAARASPFISALTAASPFTGGKPNGFKSLRYQIWLETDDERCGLWPEMVDDEGLTFRRYIERALATPAMLFVRNGRHVQAERKPYSEYAQTGFQGSQVTVEDFIDHLTTFFPEVRPKGYVELRGADALIPAEAVAVAGFWRGALDDEDAREAVDERLEAMTYEALRTLQPEVARRGLEADSAAGPVGEIAEFLMRTAYERLRKDAPDCADCVVPLLERAKARRTPADDMLDRFNETGSVEKALEPFQI